MICNSRWMNFEMIKDGTHTEWEAKRGRDRIKRHALAHTHIKIWLRQPMMRKFQSKAIHSHYISHTFISSRWKKRWKDGNIYIGNNNIITVNKLSGMMLSLGQLVIMCMFCTHSCTLSLSLVHSFFSTFCLFIYSKPFQTSANIYFARISFHFRLLFTI